MNYTKDHCCVLNAGRGSWAFEPLAERLSSALGLGISAKPRSYNYVLSLDGDIDEFCGASFIPLAAVRLAADKRLIATAFSIMWTATLRIHPWNRNWMRASPAPFGNAPLR